MKNVIALMLLLIFSDIICAQKFVNPIIAVQGVPTICFSSSLYVNILTADIYSYKFGTGCTLAGKVSSITGTGVNGRIAYWNGTGSLTNSTNLLFDGTNLTSTFIGNLTGNVTGNATTVTNGVVTTGSYANPSWITSLAYAKITGAPAAGASLALDNLASVNINSTLLAQTGIDLGSTTKPFRDLFLSGSGTYGTNYFRFTGTPTSTRTVTFPDASITVARTDAGQTFTGTQTFGGTVVSSLMYGGTGAAASMSIRASSSSSPTTEFISFGVGNNGTIESARIIHSGNFQFNVGIAPDGGGLKHGRITTGSIGGASTSLITLTWTTTFADANYTATCSIVEATASSLSLSIQHIEVQSAGSLQVRILNNAAGALTGTLQCIAIHD